MKCPNCRTVMKESKETIRYDECGLQGVTLVDVPVTHCPNCGERAVGIPRMAELHRTLATHIASRPEKLGPAELRFLRKHLGLSGADFARKVGIDPASLSRMESKEKPQAIGEQLERLVRVMVLTEKPVESYPLEEMASEPPAAVVMRLEADRNGWHQAEAR